MRTTKKLLIFFFITAIGSKNCHAAAVNTQYSSINFPYQFAYINATQPTITGSLVDDNRNPVHNETVEISLNGTYVGTTVSNSAGIYALPITHDLPDGQYVVTVFCTDSQRSLASHSFTIDTTTPTLVIENPGDHETLNSTMFTVAGTTEANAMVETFLDDDTYGLVCYADESGNWSIEYSADLGAHAIQAQATDCAGNQSPISDIRHFTITV